LLQLADQCLNGWKILAPMMDEIELTDTPDLKTREKARKLAKQMVKLDSEIFEIKRELVDYAFADNPDPYIKQVYNDLVIASNQLARNGHQLQELLVVDNLMGDMRQSQFIGMQPVNNSGRLYDHTIRRAIATSDPTDTIFQMIGMSVWIFVSYFLGVVVYGMVEYQLSEFLALACGGICGLLCFAIPWILIRRKNQKRAVFAKHAHEQSTVFRAKLIKVVQEGPASFYVHFEDDGKRVIVPIEEEMRRSLCRNGGAKYINVLKYPKYKGGYGYMAIDPNNFENKSSAKFID
jgi:hypothetical protein